MVRRLESHGQSHGKKWVDLLVIRNLFYQRERVVPRAIGPRGSACSPDLNLPNLFSSPPFRLALSIRWTRGPQSTCHNASALGSLR